VQGSPQNAFNRDSGLLLERVCRQCAVFEEPSVTETNKISFSEFEQFEPDVFWQHHGRKILWATAAALAVGLIAYMWQQQRLQEAETASSRLVQANDAPSLQQIIQAYPDTEVAAAAMIRLADMYFREGRYPDAANVYQGFLQKDPGHFLIDAANLGLAAIQESAGNYTDARSLYSKLITTNPNGYGTMEAKLGMARCAELLGQPTEAQQIYNEVMAADQSGAWQGEAIFRWTILNRAQAQTAQSKQLIKP